MSFEAVLDDKEVREFIQGMDKNLKDVQNGKSEYIGILSSIVFKDLIKHFESESGSEGKWKPWSDIYKKHMDNTGKGGNKILQDSGRMRQSFKPTNWRKVKDGVLWFNDAKTKKGFPYAFAHNEGGSKLPKREFMWLSDKAMEDITQQTLAFILEKDL